MLRKLVKSVVSARLLDGLSLSDQPAVDARTVHQEFMPNGPLRMGGVEPGRALDGVVSCGEAPATAQQENGELSPADSTAETKDSGAGEYAASLGREAAAPTGEGKDQVWREEAAQLRQVGAKLKQVLEAEMRSRGLSGLDLDFEWDKGVSAETPAAAVQDKTDASLAQVPDKTNASLAQAPEEQEAVKHQESLRESEEERRQREMVAAELQRERERADFLQLELQKIQHDLHARTAAAPAGDEVTSQEQPDDAPVHARWPPLTFQDLTEIFTTLDADGHGRITHRQLLRGLRQHAWVAEKLGAPASTDNAGNVPERCVLAFGEIHDDASRTIGDCDCLYVCHIMLPSLLPLPLPYSLVFERDHTRARLSDVLARTQSLRNCVTFTATRKS